MSSLSTVEFCLMGLAIVGSEYFLQSSPEGPSLATQDMDSRLRPERGTMHLDN